MAFPAGLKVWIEFGTLYSNVWTDVTADVDTSSQVSMKFGRTDAQATPIAATLGIRLENNLGSYTPLRQVLADGVTANPNYPNVVPDKRIKVSWTISATEYDRFVGFIDSWVPGLDNGVRPYVDIIATDITGRLGSIVLQSPLMQEVLFDGPALFWPLTDPAGSSYAVQLGSFSSPTTPLYEVPPGANPLIATVAGTGGGDSAFGGNGVGSGNGTAIALTPLSASNGNYLFAPLQTTIGTFGMFAGEIFVQIPTVPAATATVLLINTPFVSLEIQVDTSGHVVMLQNGSAVATSTNSVADGLWHALAFTVATLTGPPRTQLTLWVDAVSIGSANVTGTSSGSSGVYVSKPGGLFTGNVGYLSLYPTAPSSTRLAAHYAAATGYAGDTTGARIARVLTWAGLTSSQWNLDPGAAIVGTYPQNNKTVLQYCQDMAVTEGGGAVVYATPDGLVRFADRNFRTSPTVAVTVDAQKDLTSSSYLPSFDKSKLQNQAVVTRATADTTASVQTVTVTNTYPTNSGSLTSYATTDLDALANAQEIVARNANPGFRFPQIGIALLTAVNNLYVAVAGVQIGSRIRLNNIPTGKAPATQVDVLVEGWTETFTNSSYNWVADTSPADAPTRGIYDDTTRGRYGPGTSMTLTGTYAAGTTTIQVTTTAGNPTFTTVSARYPLSIKVNEEEIVLNSAPGGASSPQTFTGVTRGANGTPAASQAAGSQVHLAHQATYTL